ncbi:MAG: hypothetical protein M5R36_16960 [Deltaproteobacteria bacterium]|nr:hypothetical protein [Deltaproteobacteria bacterium]
MKNVTWFGLVLLVILALAVAIPACGDDDDDDDDDDDAAGDDDDDDDATGDDDGGDCSVNDVCGYVVDTCNDALGFGSVTACEEAYLADCASAGDTADTDAFLLCVCACEAADPSCEDMDSFGTCEGECFTEFCGTFE